MDKTVKATHVPDFDHANDPGDYFITPPNEHEDGMRRLSFKCPCGCGMLAGIRVRNDGQHTAKGWEWNGDEDKPTVKPSIKINNGHWHGYLTDGKFVSC